MCGIKRQALYLSSRALVSLVLTVALCRCVLLPEALPVQVSQPCPQPLSPTETWDGRSQRALLPKHLSWHSQEHLCSPAGSVCFSVRVWSPPCPVTRAKGLSFVVQLKTHLRGNGAKANHSGNAYAGVLKQQAECKCDTFVSGYMRPLCEDPGETCCTKSYCCIWGPILVAFLRADFMTARVAHWNSPNNTLADKGKPVFSGFLLCCFVAEL